MASGINDRSNWIVYLHVNKFNSKIYVGITSKKYATERWGHEGSGYIKNKHFTAAINKYGWDGFEHIIIAKNIPAKSAFMIEQELIELYNTTDPANGYNHSNGGESGNFIDGRTKERQTCKHMLERRKDFMSEDEYYECLSMLYEDLDALHELLLTEFNKRECKICGALFIKTANRQSLCEDCRAIQKERNKAVKKDYKHRNKQAHRLFGSKNLEEAANIIAARGESVKDYPNIFVRID